MQIILLLLIQFQCCFPVIVWSEVVKLSPNFFAQDPLPWGNSGKVGYGLLVFLGFFIIAGVPLF
jgi:hypothetical protein